MPEKIKIIQDISLLFELSLSVGGSLDPQENCYHFLRTLISRKSLNFGAVWLHRPEPNINQECDLFFIHPHFRETHTTMRSCNLVMQELAIKPYFTISSQDPRFKEIIQEKKVENGSYAIFKLGDLGVLKLFASNRLNGFREIEMAQLKQVVDKLKISLDGCFAHLQLKRETENRLVAQKALEESENKLRRIIDSSLDAVVSVDNHGDILEWNVQAEKMFGYTREEALGLPLKDLIIPERHRLLYRQSVRDDVLLSKVQEVNKRYEIKCKRKNELEFLAEISITADRTNKNILFVGFIRDITEQRKAKKEIEQARVRMETLITNLQTGILLEDNNRRIALVNKSFCEIFNIPVEPEMLIGTDCSEAARQAMHLFEQPEAFIKSCNKALINRVLVENEVFIMVDGRVLERNFIPLFSGDRYEGHLWQYRDITERQNAQLAIRESEEKYRGVLENMELGLLEVDLDDNIIRANNSFCQMLGYLPWELVGQNAGETFLPESSKKIIYERNAERKLGLSSVYEIQMRRKNGELIWGIISGAPIKNGQGQIVGSIGIQFDLTARKKLENELAEAKLTAERARFAERQFLTHMSHEIRTPINAVIGMTHLLYETQPDATQLDYLDGLRFSADSLLGIIDNILDLSKIDAGEIEFEQKAFDLDYLIKLLLSTLQFKIQEKDLKIIQTFDTAIKNLVVGDPTRINQILTNLVGNALKFTEKGEVSLNTKLLDHSDGYLIEFRIHDTGIGIAPDKLETIFEYFKQANVQINRKFGGTGLGLTIVKQLVEMQGGSIRVESKLGAGSDFIITLRFGDSGISLAEQETLHEKSRPNADHHISGLHFLIVEDNALNQKLLCKTMESWGCTFDVANNGQEALAKSLERQFDVVLMDLHMPELDGFETTIAIRKDAQNPNRTVPIVALTAAAMSEDKKKAFEVGMNGFLTKPVAPKMLQAYLLGIIPDLYPLRAFEPGPTPVFQDKTPKLDLSYLEELSGGDYVFIQQMIDTFLLETTAVLQELSLLVAQEKWEDVYKLIHKLKPNFTMMGMSDLQQQASLIEANIRNGSTDPATIRFQVNTLIRDAKIFLSLLEQYTLTK